jgi:hypothetical protein
VGGLERDIIAGGGGDDFFYSESATAPTTITAGPAPTT